MSSFDMEARRVIEALRSGIPSRAVGRYFTEARPGIMSCISGEMQEVSESGKSSGKILTGRYGEGKTHLLNTVFGMAQEENMVVSYLSLGKETPFDKLYLVYQKLINNTYLPGREQPGIAQLLEQLSLGSPAASELAAYAAGQLGTDKLYFLLRSYLGTQDIEEKYLLQADLEGDFIAASVLKKTYKRIFNETARYKFPFSKMKHTQDYFSFMSYLFVLLGYKGWIILIDEAELIGRLGKKARLKAYRNMGYFLNSPESLRSCYTVFAMASSFEEDVLDGKNDMQTLEESGFEDAQQIRRVMNRIREAEQLKPLTKEEIRDVISRIRDFHGRAYDWEPAVPVETILKECSGSGFLLRTKLRAAIEFLDQLYQYGEAGKTRITELGVQSYDMEIPALDELVDQQAD